MLFLTLMIVVNIAISYFNAWSTGKSWIESKASGGIVRLLSWSVATMSACGFTWAYLAILAVLAQLSGKVAPKYIDAMFSMGYLTIIIPLIGSGIAITIQSWASFWRDKNIGNGALAGWNTFAGIYNIYEATHTIPDAIKSLANISADEDEAPLTVFAILAALFAVGGGITTTALIIRKTAKQHASEIVAANT